MYVITALFVYVTELLITLYLFDSVLPEKTRKGKKILIGTLLYLALSIVYLQFNNAAVNIILFSVVNIIFSKLCYICTIKKSIIISLLMSALSICTEFFIIIVSSLILNGSIELYKTNISVFAVSSFICKLLYFMTIKLFIMHFPSFKDNKKHNTPLFMFLFPGCTILIFYILYFVSALYELPKAIDIAIFVFSIVTTLSIILTYIFYGKTQTELDEIYKTQAETERVHTDIAYYAILDRQNEQLKTIIHDEKNHLATIKSLSDNKEINDYIDRLCGEIKVSSLFGNTENKMLDLVLNKYSYICENDDIRFNVTAKTANLTFIENTDLVTVMSNMLDNAVEAAKVSAEKYIDLSINRTNGFDIITCTNSCDKAPDAKGDVLNTTKNDGVFHGLGVKSIKKIVSRYKGSFEWSYDMNEKEFVVYIAFKN